MLARLRKVLYWAACSLVIAIGVVIAAANIVREPEWGMFTAISEWVAGNPSNRAADIQRGAPPRAPARLR